MISTSGRAYLKISEARLGSLMLLTSHSGPEFALRVDVPHQDGSDRGGVLVLQAKVPGENNRTLVYSDVGDEFCLDLGVPEFAFDAAIISDSLAIDTYDPRPGMLAIVGTDLLIYAAYGRFPVHRGWWQISSGKRVSGEGRLLIERWCVGLRNVDGKFMSQLRFPEHEGNKVS